jgi:hypothetical protein
MGELLNCFAQARFGSESSEPERCDSDYDDTITAEDLVDALRDEVDLIQSATKSALDRHEQQITELRQTVALVTEICERLAKAIPRDSLEMSASTS